MKRNIAKMLEDYKKLEGKKDSLSLENLCEIVDRNKGEERVDVSGVAIDGLHVGYVAGYRSASKKYKKVSHKREDLSTSAKLGKGIVKSKADITTDELEELRSMLTPGAMSSKELFEVITRAYYGGLYRGASM